MSPSAAFGLAAVAATVSAVLAAAAAWFLRRHRGDAAAACEAAFEATILAFDGDDARVAAGALDALASDLGAAREPQAVVRALCEHDDGLAASLAALRESGAPFFAEIALAGARVLVEGRTAGALALVRVARRPSAATPAGEAFAAFVDERPEPAWMTDAAGAPTWVNRAWLEAVGAPSLEAARERNSSLDGEADRIAAEAAGERRPASIVRWVRTRDGRRALRFLAQPLAAGGAGVWSDDVTGAETAADALGRQQAAQEAMFEPLADAVAVFGADRRLAFHNTAFVDLWGLEPAWLVERPAHAEILDRLRRRGRLPENADWTAFRAAELARHAALAPAAPELWRLASGRTVRVASQPHDGGGLMMVFSDVTPELRLNAQFNHLLQVQQATLDKLSDAVAVFGADARLRLHNEAFESFWSAPPGQLSPGMDFDEMVEIARRRMHDLQFWRDLKARIADPDPAARAPRQCEIQTADRRVVAHQSRPLPDGATLISFIDVTDARRLEQALADRESALGEAERLKREFVNSVSHELRTPLTTILGYAELLEQEEAELEPAARGYMAAVRAAAVRLGRSINNVLDMAQIDAGEAALEMGDIDVAELLESAAGRWRVQAEEQGIEITAAPGEAAGLMRGDATRLADVLDHLTENALRHTPPGGCVTLSAERSQGEVRLQVADTGRGVPFHIQAHIFDRFGGQDRAATGLGLALVKALVELHGGWVTLESEPGEGETFTCHLPETPEAGEGRPELF